MLFPIAFCVFLLHSLTLLQMDATKMTIDSWCTLDIHVIWIWMEPPRTLIHPIWIPMHYKHFKYKCPCEFWWIPHRFYVDSKAFHEDRIGFLYGFNIEFDGFPNAFHMDPNAIRSRFRGIPFAFSTEIVSNGRKMDYTCFPIGSIWILMIPKDAMSDSLYIQYDSYLIPTTVPIDFHMACIWLL